jgi:hypothetical protein
LQVERITHMTTALVIIGSLVLAVIILFAVSQALYKKKLAAMTPADREKYLEDERQHVEELKGEDEQKMKKIDVMLEHVEEQRAGSASAMVHGFVNPALICPHCQTKGQVRTKLVKHKMGISGGKATAAVLTGGFSVLATGLSRKEEFTEACCGNCGSKWSC